MYPKFFTLGIVGILISSLLAFSGCTVSVQPTPDSPRPGVGPSQFDISFFYDELAPYGEWFELERHGWVWTPYHVPYGWRPYTHGRWVYTDYGWTWTSDWEWGWAPFHYGRWLFDPEHGWVWVPGREWAPAWVAWRSGPGYIGWAPLPPGVGFEVRASFEGSVRPQWWCFVEDRGFLEMNLRGSILPAARNLTIVRITQNVTNYTVVQNRIVNRSLSVDQVERVVQRPAPRYRLVDRDMVPAARDRVKGNEIYMFRRPLTEAPYGRTPKTEVVPKQVPGLGQRPGAPSTPKSMTMPELLQRQAAERRELLTHQQDQRKKLEQEHRREIQQPPKEKSITDLRKEHEDEKRDLEENAQQERQLLQHRHERERKTIGVR